MKRVLITAMAFVILTMNVSAVWATEEVEGLSEKIDALIMEKNFTSEQFEAMDRQYLIDYDDWFWNDYIVPTKLLGKMNTSSEEEEYEYCLKRNRPDYRYGVLITEESNKYAQQYSNNNVFHYLFQEGKKYWAVMPCRGFGLSIKCREDGSRIYNMEEEFDGQYTIVTLTTEMIDFLKEKNEIKKQLLEKGETRVDDIKVFSVSRGLTLLYIKCGSNEYLMKLYGFAGYCDYVPQIEEYKLYSAQEVIEVITVPGGDDWPPRYTAAMQMTETKPIYETEAEVLKEQGLLKGNEKGLDLLKPLTRIEATALLVRAMGYEDEKTDEESYFKDIKSEDWGVKYANIAKDKKIAEGVGEDKFAPDEAITSSQFATLILRNMGENPDWETAIETLIERGLITSEQADKMDLFTRGDMAKIIYEAKQKNML